MKPAGDGSEPAHFPPITDQVSSTDRAAAAAAVASLAHAFGGLGLAPEPASSSAIEPPVLLELLDLPPEMLSLVADMLPCGR